MKLSSRLCGLCGSGTFMLISYTGFFSTLPPWDILSWTLAGRALPFSHFRFFETLFLAACGALLMGYMGYCVGNILSHPKGPRPKAKPATRPSRPIVKAVVPEEIEGSPPAEELPIETLPVEESLLEPVPPIEEELPALPAELPEAP